MITDFANQEQIERETLENPSDMLDAVWRPDGGQIASATLDGKIIFWNPQDAQVQGEINCTRDIRIGRSKTQMVSAENLSNDSGWRHLAYTADGKVVLLYSVSYTDFTLSPFWFITLFRRLIQNYVLQYCLTYTFLQVLNEQYVFFLSENTLKDIEF